MEVLVEVFLEVLVEVFLGVFLEEFLEVRGNKCGHNDIKGTQGKSVLRV